MGSSKPGDPDTSAASFGTPGASGTPETSLEALRPRRTLWSAAIIALLVLVVGATVWVTPTLLQVPLGSPADRADGAVVPVGTPVNLIYTAVEADVVGGVTITGIDPVGNARLMGAWLLDASQQKQFEYATTAWGVACYDPASPDLTVPACRLPTDDSQADALIAALVRRGAPLDDTTALPRHLANRGSGVLVGLWLASECENQFGNAINLRVARFGIRGAASVDLLSLPGCLG